MVEAALLDELSPDRLPDRRHTPLLAHPLVGEAAPYEFSG